MAVRTAAQIKAAIQSLLSDSAPEASIDPSEVGALLGDIVDSVPSIGIAGADLSEYAPVAPSFYLGLSDDATPSVAEAAIPAGKGSGRLPAFSGKRVAIYRVASDPDITRVEFSDDPGTNAFAQFEEFRRRGNATTLTLPSGLRYKAWISGRMTKAAAVTVTAS